MIRKIDKIFKLLILWIFSENKWTNPYNLVDKNIFSDRETLLHLKKNPNVGIIRYGNSELGLIVGNSPRTQKYNKKLRNRLVHVCRNYNSNTIKKYILTLPFDTINRKYIESWYPGRAARWAMKFLFKKSQIYGTTFCFRILDVLDNDMENYISLVKSLFIGRKIIYVGPLVGKNPDIPNFIIPSEVLKIPEKNAFDQFEKIILEIKQLSKKYENPLVVIVGGITASVISYELNMSNITCYDFGQYERLHKKYLQTKHEKNN